MLGLLYLFLPYNFDSFRGLSSHLRSDWSACADETSSKHFLVAQDAKPGVLLVVQELLEGAESILGAGGARSLLQQPADLIRIVLHLVIQR